MPPRLIGVLLTDPFVGGQIVNPHDLVPALCLHRRLRLFLRGDHLVLRANVSAAEPFRVIGGTHTRQGQ